MGIRWALRGRVAMLLMRMVLAFGVSDTLGSLCRARTKGVVRATSFDIVVRGPFGRLIRRCLLGRLVSSTGRLGWIVILLMT